MSNDERTRAFLSGTIGSSNLHHTDPYHADQVSGRILGDQIRASMHASRHVASDPLQEEVGRERRRIPIPQMADYGGETPAYCQAIEEYHAKCIEVLIAAMAKLHMTDYEWAEKAGQTIRELRKPWPQRPVSFFSVWQEVGFELEIRIRSIPKLHLLFPGTAAGGNFEKYVKDKRQYEERERYVRNAVHTEYAAALKEENAARERRYAEYARKQRRKIINWFIAGAVALGSSIILTKSAHGETANSNCPKRSGTEALPLTIHNKLRMG
jgi:hypothetical protein